MIELQNIIKEFKNGDHVTRALDNINTTIKKGEFVAIMGPSGSGKSTMMNILGLLDNPTKGNYLLNEQNVAKLSEKEFAKIRNKEIGFIFQSYNLLKRLSVYRNVELPLIYSGIPKNQRKTLVFEALERVGLKQKANNKPNQLSGGQMQRVAIARALVTKPSFLLADEPTGALDQKTGKMVLDLFIKLHTEGATIILVTHDAKVATVANRTIEILDGKVRGEN
ncbi:MAG: ABC transporter ATP-binding protein [Culicoidibacterales bacterium]